MKLPSVTQILRDTGMCPDYGGERCRLKALLGTDVHAICAGKQLPPGPAHDYARQFRLWLEKTGAKVLRSEFEVKGEINGFRYVGHPDLEIEWAGQKWIVDLKTGALTPDYGLQLAAYCNLMPNWCKRAVLLLRPARHRLVPFNDAFDYEAWRNCLELWYWKRRARMLRSGHAK